MSFVAASWLAGWFDDGSAWSIGENLFGWLWILHCLYTLDAVPLLFFSIRTYVQMMLYA
jgi:hypothetical protein